LSVLDEAVTLGAMSDLDLVVRGGLVVDGTGAEPRPADVAIDGGRVVAVGEVTEDSRREIDADGLVVAPGVVDVHTHFDAQLFWDAAATPSCLHGITTVIGGNCGFSIAPLGNGQAGYLAQMLARVEGMPLATLEQAVPWDWSSFADYLARFDGRLAVNAGFLVGHTTLRRAVMGADDERVATDAELDEMATLLGRSLAEGGLGFSSSLANTHNDGDGRPVSSRYSTRDELLRLATVTGEHAGTTLEFIPSVATRFSDDDMDLMTAMSLAADRPLNWNLLNVNSLLWDAAQQRLTAGDFAAERGGRVVALTMPVSSTLRVNFVTGFVLDAFEGWTDLFALPLDERRRELADPARRAQMRSGVETVDTTLTRRMRNWSSLVVEQTYSDATRRYEGRTLGDIAAVEGGDAFEHLLDIALADDLRTVIVIPPIGNDPESWQMRASVWRDPRALIGGSDSGAHLDMIDTFVYATSLLGPVVRDGYFTLAEAVRSLTDLPARLYGVTDRGRVAEGWLADLVVFDPATIGPGPMEMRADLPAGASRLYADAHGVEHVLVNGVEIVAGGRLTGATPGTVLRSGRDTETVHAGAAAATLHA